LRHGPRQSGVGPGHSGIRGRVFLAPVVLYFLLLLFAFSFFLVSRFLPCDWPLHEAFNGFNPDCPNLGPAD
jgi:hypothetical protein